MPCLEPPLRPQGIIGEHWISTLSCAPVGWRAVALSGFRPNLGRRLESGQIPDSIGRTPRRVRPRLAVIVEVAVAFAAKSRLGNRNVLDFVAAVPRPTRSRTYASPARYRDRRKARYRLGRLTPDDGRPVPEVDRGLVERRCSSRS